MSDSGTTFVGPLGSTIHCLRADSETVAAVAGLDWNDSFRRVCLDPVRGVITLMAPSSLHEDLTGIFDDLVDLAADAFSTAVRKLRSTRLRGEDDPAGTGMEPDCAFYLGASAVGFVEVIGEGLAARNAFLERNAPELVSEVEITHADRGKIERYGDPGVREFWRLRARADSPAPLRADFLALGRGAVPRPLEASEVLPGLTPEEVCDAVAGVQRSVGLRDRREVVVRIVRRRREASFRVREEGPGYEVRPRKTRPAPPDDSSAAPSADRGTRLAPDSFAAAPAEPALGDETAAPLRPTARCGAGSR